MIPIHSFITGGVFLRNFDEGVMRLLGASTGLPATEGSGTELCYRKPVNFGGSLGTKNIPVYFSQPEPALQKKVFPFITIARDDASLALERWMSVGQLEYRVGLDDVVEILKSQNISGSAVSGYGEYTSKLQAFPYDISYTISVWDRYEQSLQILFQQVLKAITPIGRIIVYDSLNLERSYDYFYDGGIVPLHEVIDVDTRARGYAITIRVQGELDQADPFATNAVTGFDLNLGLY